MPKSNKVAAVITERVRCSFATPQPDGTPGFHEVKLAIGFYKELRHVSCECQKLHGNGVVALYEMAKEGGSSVDDMCFSHVITLLTSLRKLNTNPADLRASIGGTRLLTGVINSTIAASRSRASCRNGNVLNLYSANKQGTDQFLDPAKRDNYKVDTFNKVVKKLNKYHFDGQKLLALHYNPAREQVIKLVGSPSYTLAQRNISAGSSWDIYEDQVKRWAFFGIHDLTESGSLDLKRCAICKEYWRYKHTSSVKHLQRALDVIKLYCMALSSTGLKMLNDPKRKAIFLGPTHDDV